MSSKEELSEIWTIHGKWAMLREGWSCFLTNKRIATDGRTIFASWRNWNSWKNRKSSEKQDQNNGVVATIRAAQGCCDESIGIELPWPVVHQERELELKDLRELGVCRKTDECTTVAKYNVGPLDTTCLDTT